MYCTMKYFMGGGDPPKSGAQHMHTCKHTLLPTAMINTINYVS